MYLFSYYVIIFTPTISSCYSIYFLHHRDSLLCYHLAIFLGRIVCGVSVDSVALSLYAIFLPYEIASRGHWTNTEKVLIALVFEHY